MNYRLSAKSDRAANSAVNPKNDRDQHENDMILF